ncbi:uncharacterized protein HMPREF1541_05829, partial [Cyphellophora europaea CBS 101466]
DSDKDDNDDDDDDDDSSDGDDEHNDKKKRYFNIFAHAAALPASASSTSVDQAPRQLKNSVIATTLPTPTLPLSTLKPVSTIYKTITTVWIPASAPLSSSPAIAPEATTADQAPQPLPNARVFRRSAPDPMVGTITLFGGHLDCVAHQTLCWALPLGLGILVGMILLLISCCAWKCWRRRRATEPDEYLMGHS